MFRKWISISIVLTIWLSFYSVNAIEDKTSPWAESYVNASQSSNTLDSTFFKDYNQPITRAEFALPYSKTL